MNDYNLEEVKETKESNHEDLKSELVKAKLSNGPTSNQDDQLLTMGKQPKKREGFNF